MSTQTFPFHGIALTGLADFDTYRAAYSSVLDERYAYEMSLAANGTIVRPGVCPITGESTLFTTTHEVGDDAPDWRNQQVCRNGLNMNRRALVHNAMALSGKPLDEVLVIDLLDKVPPALRPHAGAIEHRPVDRIGLTDSQDLGRYDAIIIADGLERALEPEALFRQLSTFTKPGRRIIITTTFYYNDAQSIKDGDTWRFGWDLLDRLNDNGFKQARAITFWAPEYGYLGPQNFLIEATKN